MCSWYFSDMNQPISEISVSLESLNIIYKNESLFEKKFIFSIKRLLALFSVITNNIGIENDFVMLH